MLALLLEPLHYNYMLRALAVGVLLGSLCAFLSVFLILSGWSLIGDALSHSIVPGVACAYIFSLPYLLSAFVSAFLALAAMFFIELISCLKRTAIMAVVFTSFFALGLFLSSLYPMAVDIQNILLGNLLTLSPTDAFQIMGLVFFSFLLLLLLSKSFMLIFFNETHAQILGLPVKWYKVIFFFLLYINIVSALQAVGALLVISMAITPGATAYLLTDKFSRLILVAVGLGGLTSFIGVYLSYFFNAPTGAFIVLLQFLFFLLTAIFAPHHGLLSQHFSAGRG